MDDFILERNCWGKNESVSRYDPPPPPPFYFLQTHTHTKTQTHTHTHTHTQRHPPLLPLGVWGRGAAAPPLYLLRCEEDLRSPGQVFIRVT